MIPGRAYAENLALVALTLQNPNLEGGSIVECGTWRGGMSAGMIEVAGPHRSYHFLTPAKACRRPCPPIAVLRLDVDWYESTMICLKKFWDHVLPGGLVLLDDYYAWEGCSRAVHAFLAKREAKEQLHQGTIGRVPFIIKAI